MNKDRPKDMRPGPLKVSKSMVAKPKLARVLFLKAKGWRDAW